MLIQTAFSQKSDSTQERSILKWKLDILLDNYFYDMPACTLAVDKSRSAIDSLRVTLTNGQTLIQLRTEQRDAKVKEANELRLVIKASEEATKLKLKRAKKRGFISGVSLSGGVAIVLVLIL